MDVQVMTVGQEDQVIHSAQQAVRRVFASDIINEEGLERLLQNSDRFEFDVIASMRKLSACQLYADEQEASDRKYPSDYNPKHMHEQVRILREAFPGLGSFDENLATGPLPLYAEGWFAIPRWQKVASNYCEAVQMALRLLECSRECEYFETDEEQFTDYLHQSARTEIMYKDLAGRQKGHDILVIPGQFGLFYRGCSVRRTQEIFLKNEFGPGLFAGICMLLTHPERLQSSDDLLLDLPGDFFPPEKNSQIKTTPVVFCNDVNIEVSKSPADSYNDEFGSVSLFLPPGT